MSIYLLPPPSEPHCINYLILKIINLKIVIYDMHNRNGKYFIVLIFINYIDMINIKFLSVIFWYNIFVQQYRIWYIQYYRILFIQYSIICYTQHLIIMYVHDYQILYKPHYITWYRIWSIQYSIALQSLTGSQRPDQYYRTV